MVSNDSMRHVPPSAAAPRGAWLSSIAAEERLGSLLAGSMPKASVVDRLVAEDLSSGLERPDVLQLVRPGPRAASGPGKNWTGPGDPYVGCSAQGVEGRQDGFRTIADIDVGPSWSFVLDYTDTRTTSWDIGVEGSRGAWMAGGTTSFSNSSSAGFNAEFGPYPGRFREAYQVKLVHAKVLWRCASRTSPGPFYIRTVEPESWTGGTFNQGEPIIPCHANQRVPVAGNTTGWRKKDKASRYSAAAAAFGFSGQAAVTYAKDIKLGWHNFLGHPRDVCGESGHPYLGNTRVAAMDEHR
jgi:hypothetical protein